MQELTVFGRNATIGGGGRVDKLKNKGSTSDDALATRKEVAPDDAARFERY